MQWVNTVLDVIDGLLDGSYGCLIGLHEWRRGAMKKSAFGYQQVWKCLYCGEGKHEGDWFDPIIVNPQPKRELAVIYPPIEPKPSDADWLEKNFGEQE